MSITISTRWGRLDMAQLRARADQYAAAYNDAVARGIYNATARVPVSPDADPGEEESVLLRVLAAECVGLYRRAAEREAIADRAAREDPIAAACREITYPTLRLSDGKTGELDQKVPCLKLADAEAEVDVAAVDSAYRRANDGRSPAPDPLWQARAELLNMQLCTATLREFYGRAARPADFRLSREAQKLAAGDNAPPAGTDSASLLAALTAVVQGMIGEAYTPTDKDVAYIRAVYARMGRGPLTVACANHATVRRAIAHVCHRLIRAAGYIVTYPQRRGAATPAAAPAPAPAAEKPAEPAPEPKPAEKPAAKKTRKPRAKKPSPATAGEEQLPLAENAAPEPASGGAFAVGARVTHPAFGAGEILAAAETDGEMVYEVAFDRVGKKRLMASRARLAPAA